MVGVCSVCVGVKVGVGVCSVGGDVKVEWVCVM